MLRGSSRSLILAVLVVALASFAPACKSVPPAQETPAPQAPSFESSAKPAERVDDTAGFKEASPETETFADTPSSLADKLNAQGILRSIYFDFDKSDVRADGRAMLDGNAAHIRQNGSLAVRIEGHCDERGTVEYNLALGDRRARAAREALVAAGIPATRLRTISYGKERPADPGHNETAWARNRRAEFIFVAE